MRIQALNVAVASLAMLALAGCAGPMGTAVGTVVGGASWGAMKVGELGVKGAKGGAKVVAGTGRVIGKTASAGGKAVSGELGSNKDSAADQVGDIAQR